MKKGERQRGERRELTETFVVKSQLGYKLL